MQDRTKRLRLRRGGRPRKFDESEALVSMQRQLWTRRASPARRSRPSLARRDSTGRASQRPSGKNVDLRPGHRLLRNRQPLTFSPLDPGSSGML
jgi:hypothetical protein